MKYLITESQYDNIFSEKNYRVVSQMWDDDMDTSEIAEITGLRESVVLYLLREKEIYIDCSFADTLLPTLFKTIMVNKNYQSGNETLSLEWAFGGFIAFDYEDPKYILRGYATPFWNKECVTPVDSHYFQDKETGEYEDGYDKLEMYTDYTPDSFDSIQEFIDFLNQDYPKYLFKAIKKINEKRSFN